VTLNLLVLIQGALRSIGLPTPANKPSLDLVGSPPVALSTSITRVVRIKIATASIEVRSLTLIVILSRPVALVLIVVPLVARLAILITTLLLLILSTQLCLAVSVLISATLLHHSKILSTSIEVNLPCLLNHGNLRTKLLL